MRTRPLGIRYDTRAEYTTGSAVRIVTGCGWRLMAYSGISPAASGFHANKRRAPFHHFPTPEPAEHTAFVRGAMPPYVYADWCEEQGVDLPPEVYALLRNPQLVEELT